MSDKKPEKTPTAKDLRDSMERIVKASKEAQASLRKLTEELEERGILRKNEN